MTDPDGAAPTLWVFHEGTRVNGHKVQADLSGWGDYVISHRQQCFNVAYRPYGRHVNVGTFETLETAKAAAEQHAASNTQGTAKELLEG